MTNSVAGKITHFFPKIMVAVLEATQEPIKVGDVIRIGDEGNGFTQTVESLQVDHLPIAQLEIGKEAGLKVNQETHSGELVYLVG
ncbi:MAG: hypothetical protein WCT01_01570 [Candidatus Shapirobacteria bacterium]|jgi:hypothetical protein